MLFLLLASLLVLLGGLLVVYFMGKSSADRKRPSGVNSTANAEPVPDKRWNAVLVVSGQKPCHAVKALEDQPFLLDEVPTLPLVGCNAHCRCKYQHQSDRRQDSRRVPYAENSVFSNAVGFNRRVGRGRRVSDHPVLS